MRSTSKFVAAVAVLSLTIPAPVQGQFAACDTFTRNLAAGLLADALFNLDICKGEVQGAWLDGFLAAVNVPMGGLEPRDGRIESVMSVHTLSIWYGDVETTYTVGSGIAENPLEALGDLANIANAFGVSQRSSGGASVEQFQLGRRAMGTKENDGQGGCTITGGGEGGTAIHKGDNCAQVEAVAREFHQAAQRYENN